MSEGAEARPVGLQCARRKHGGPRCPMHGHLHKHQGATREGARGAQGLRARGDRGEGQASFRIRGQWFCMSVCVGQVGVVAHKR